MEMRCWHVPRAPRHVPRAPHTSHTPRPTLPPAALTCPHPPLWLQPHLFASTRHLSLHNQPSHAPGPGLLPTSSAPILYHERYWHRVACMEGRVTRERDGAERCRDEWGGLGGCGGMRALGGPAARGFKLLPVPCAPHHTPHPFLPPPPPASSPPGFETQVLKTLRREWRRV